MAMCPPKLQSWVHRSQATNWTSSGLFIQCQYLILTFYLNCHVNHTFLPRLYYHHRCFSRSGFWFHLSCPLEKTFNLCKEKIFIFHDYSFMMFCFWKSIQCLSMRLTVLAAFDLIISQRSDKRSSYALYQKCLIDSLFPLFCKR